MNIISDVKKFLLYRYKEKLKSNKLDELNFVSGGFLTIGAEVEIQLQDSKNLSLIPKALEILEKTNKSVKIKKEFYLSTLEINTSKCNNALEIERDLQKEITTLKNISESFNIKLSTTGCHPFSKYSDCVISPSTRYNDMIDRNQWLTKRMTVYGLHTHIGMSNGNQAIQFMNFFLRFIPHFLALSASSPFWQGEDTGLASCRPTTYEALPTAGLPYWFNSWAEFEHLYNSLKRSKSVFCINDLWWDIRPSPKFGTIEIRACDGCATLAETSALVAFIHSLAIWFSENSDWLYSIPQPERWILRENKWRAMRHGLQAEVITNLMGLTKFIKDDIYEWLEKLNPIANKYNYLQHFEIIKNICEKGNSADRQRKIFQKYNNIIEVAKFNSLEFESQKPIYDY